MAILSEGKGIMMWLKRRGNNEHFASYLLKIFNEQTGESFYRITYTSCDSKRFQRFTTWYSNQDLQLLNKSYQVYLINKAEQKEKSLAEYYQSELHQFILKNKGVERNTLYKKVKNKMRFGEFKAAYNKSLMANNN